MEKKKRKTYNYLFSRTIKDIANIISYKKVAKSVCYIALCKLLSAILHYGVKIFIALNSNMPLKMPTNKKYTPILCRNLLTALLCKSILQIRKILLFLKAQPVNFQKFLVFMSYLV